MLLLLALDNLERLTDILTLCSLFSRMTPSGITMTRSGIVFLVIGSILGLLSVKNANAQQNQVESFPLSANSPVDCDTIIDTHKFEGTCCALNTTSGNGCVLNVADGNCIVRLSG